jgi:hypothetical protein
MVADGEAVVKDIGGKLQVASGEWRVAGGGWRVNRRQKTEEEGLGGRQV